MPGFDEMGAHAGDGFELGVIGDLLEERDRPGGVRQGVERFHRGQAFFPALLVDVFHVIFVDVPRIFEHDIRQVPGGVGGIDRAADSPV